MQPLLWIAGIAAGLFALDRLFLWMETKGWIYWRKVKRKGGGLGAGLMTMNNVFDPSGHHLTEAQQEQVQEDDGEPDDDTQRKPEDQVS
jgi:hypothetical protein